MPAETSTTAIPASGRREHKKHATRRELLAAGRRLFGERGLYESSIEDLSRHAGIAKGTLYGYFASKEELVEAVVTAGFSELLTYSQQAVHGARTHDEVVAAVVEAHLSFFEENPDLMRVFHQVRGLPKFKRPEGVRLRGVLARHLAGVARLLALHHPAPRPRQSELLEIATLLFGAVSGIASTRASLLVSSGRNGMRKDTVRALEALVTAFKPAAAGNPGQAARSQPRARG